MMIVAADRLLFQHRGVEKFDRLVVNLHILPEGDGSCLGEHHGDFCIDVTRAIGAVSSTNGANGSISAENCTRESLIPSLPFFV